MPFDPNDKTKALYDAVSQDYDLGTYDEFKTKLQDPTKRKAFYDGIGAEYDLGDYNTFNQKLGYDSQEVKQQTQQTQQPQTGIPMADPNNIQNIIAEQNKKLTTPNEFDYRQKEIQDKNTAINNHVNKIVKDYQITDPQSIEQLKKDTRSQVDNGVLSLTKNNNGEPVIKKSSGFLESFSNALHHASQTQSENDFLFNADKNDAIEYLNRTKEHPETGITKETESAPSGFGGELGNLLGENAEALAKGVTGAIAGGATELTGGASFGTFLSTAKDFAHSGYSQALKQNYYTLKQQNPNMSDEEAFDKAQKASFGSEAASLGTGAVLSKSAPTQAATEGFLNTVKHTVQTAPKVLATTAAGSVAGDVAGAAVGEHKDINEILSNASEATKNMAVLHFGLGILPQMLNSGTKVLPHDVPKELQPQVENVVASMPREEVKDFYQKAEDKGEVPQGTTEQVITHLDNFDNAKKTVDDLPLTEEQKATVASRINEQTNGTPTEATTIPKEEKEEPQAEVIQPKANEPNKGSDKTTKEQGVTWENTIKEGNKINLNGKKVTIDKVTHQGKLREDGGYYEIRYTDENGVKGMIGEGVNEAPDSYILYQNGKKANEPITTGNQDATEETQSGIKQEETNQTIPEKVQPKEETVVSDNIPSIENKDVVPNPNKETLDDRIKRYSDESKQNANNDKEAQRKADVLINGVHPELKDFAEKYNGWILGNNDKPEINTAEEGKVAKILKLTYSGLSDKEMKSQLKEFGKAYDFYGSSLPSQKTQLEKDVLPNEESNTNRDAWEQTQNEYLDNAKKELGDLYSDTVESEIKDEHYNEIVKHIRNGGKISEDVYKSLDAGKKYNFDKQFGDSKIEKPDVTQSEEYKQQQEIQDKFNEQRKQKEQLDQQEKQKKEERRIADINKQIQSLESENETISKAKPNRYHSQQDIDNKLSDNKKQIEKLKKQIPQPKESNTNVTNGEKKFITHTGEEVSGQKLQGVLNKVADDMVESAKKKRTEHYASHVTEKQKDDILAKDLGYAEEVRRGEHLDNLSIQQRIDYELTGKSIPIINDNQAENKSPQTKETENTKPSILGSDVEEALKNSKELEKLPNVSFHGSKNKNLIFGKPKDGNVRQSKMQLDFGTHFTNDEYASFYSGDNGKKYPAIIDLKDPLDLTKGVWWKGDKDFERVHQLIKDLKLEKEYGAVSNYDKDGNKHDDIQSVSITALKLDKIAPKKSADAIKKLGYDGIVYEPYHPAGATNGLSFIEKKPKSYIVFDNSSIKEVNPKNISEAYLKAKADGTNPELVEAVEKLLPKDIIEKANTENNITQTKPINTEQNAIQEQSAGSVLQYPQEGVGEKGSERIGVEQGKQGQEPTSTRTETELPKEEITQGGEPPKEPPLSQATDRAGNNLVGVSHAALTDLSKKLGLNEPERGDYLPPEWYAERGRKLLAAGADPNEVNNPNNTLHDRISIARAHLENLVKDADAILKDKGVESDEYRQAHQKVNDYANNVVKKLGTEAHQAMVSLQGQRDVDTDSFTSVKQSLEEKIGKPASKAQEAKMQELTKQNEDLKNQAQEAEKKLVEATDKAFKEGVEEGKKQSKSDRAKNVADKLRKAAKFHKPDSFSAATPASLVWDSAIEIVATAIEAGGKIADAIDAGLTHIRESDWYKNLSADKQKQAENDFKQFNNDNASGNSLEDLQARFVDKKDNKFSTNESKDIWDYMKKTYLDNGTSFRDAISQVSNDLGLSWRQVSEAVTSKKTKPISDEMWKRQANYRKGQQATKSWIEAQDKSPVTKILKYIPDKLRGLAVFGHGGIFVGTHAGMTLFSPTMWDKTLPAFFRGWKFAYGNEANYERRMEELKNNPNYVVAQRAGLKNNPDNVNVEEFQKSQSWLGRLGLAGTKGFNAIKVLRQDLFDFHYNKLSDAEKQDPESAKSIARLVNNATGATNLDVPAWLNEATFAGGMELSRWGKWTRNPTEATAIALKALFTPDKATTGEKIFAKVWARRVGEQLATYTAMLAVNTALQNMINPKNPVNWTHPTKGDFLLPKFGDISVNPTSGMLSVFHFIQSLISDSFKNKKERHGDNVLQADAKNTFGYLRGKLAPGYGTLVDLKTGTDFSGNTLPYNSDKPQAGRRQLSWLEYAEEKLPIPVAEAFNVAYQSAQDNGLQKPKLDNIVDGIISGSVSFATGFRASETKPARPTPFNDVDKKDPTFKYFIDKGMELPNVQDHNVSIKDKSSRTEKQLSDYPQETQDKYDSTHKVLLKQELSKVKSKGYVYTDGYKDKDGNMKISISYSSGDKRVPLSKLNQKEIAEILHLAQSNATKKTKLKIFGTD